MYAEQAPRAEIYQRSTSWHLGIARKRIFSAAADGIPPTMTVLRILCLAPTPASSRVVRGERIAYAQALDGLSYTEHLYGNGSWCCSAVPR